MSEITFKKRKRKETIRKGGDERGEEEEEGGSILKPDKDKGNDMYKYIK